MKRYLILKKEMYTTKNSQMLKLKRWLVVLHL